MSHRRQIARCPRSTPWGAVEKSRKVAEGIWRVYTASHGGYYLSPDRWRQMHPALRASRPHAGSLWFEEDSDWALVVLAFPDLFATATRFEAVEMVSKYLADDFAIMWREFSAASEGHELKAEHDAFLEANRTKFKLGCSRFDPKRGWSMTAYRLDDTLAAEWEQPDYPYHLCSDEPFDLQRIKDGGYEVTVRAPNS